MKSIATVLALSLGSAVWAADRPEEKSFLPLREIILYSSGVGYYERSGEIEGNGKVELQFRTEDINDLLKSMVVLDRGGGTVGAITYDSRDPISKTLHSFAIDLTANPTLRDILNQMRGEAVQVFWPNAVSGTILGVEQREVESGKETKREEDFLNLFGAGIMRSIPFSQIHEIRLENAALQKELNDALATLAKGHDTEKKTVVLRFEGEGKRAVNVAYIAEAPVWKTSYRLVLGDKAPFLQGWAIVENTGDDDWENVQLSLISGRPISFKMDLYQPLYAPRPTVEPELYLSLRPQVYQDSVLPARNEPAEAGVMLEQERMGRAGRRALGDEVRLNYLAKAVAAPALKTESLGLDTGTAAVAEGGVTGELFEYALKMPVSIQRQKSAMLPIVTETVEGDKLSIYNERVQAKHPLNGFRLKNTTPLHLMQGPITVFDEGSYAGDARIEDLPPGQDRLISYAMDLQVEVDPRGQTEPENLVSVALRRGTLIATRKVAEEKSYVIHNKAKKEKELLIEHPARPDWTLEQPKKANERARDVYRFKLPVGPGKTETLVVRESRQLREEVLITNLPADRYAFYLGSSKVSSRVKDSLKTVSRMQEDIAKLAADRKAREQRMQEITQEQARIRENMGRLSQNSELYQRYVRKFDEQETEFESLRSEAGRLREQETNRQRELNDYLSGLEIE